MAKKYNIRSETDFREFYDIKLKPLYVFLQHEKKQILKKIYLHNFKFALCEAIASLLLWNIFFTDIPMDYTIFFSIVFLFVIIGIFTSIAERFFSEPEEEYRNSAKKLLLPKFMSFFEGLKYGCYPISRNIIEESSLFWMPKFRNYFFDDCIKGKYKDTAIQIAEERILGATSLCMLINFNKKFSGKTVVYSSKRDAGFFILVFLCVVVLLSCAAMYLNPEMIPIFLLSWGLGIYHYFADRKLPKYSLQKGKMESLDFSKNWKVATTNQIEARYILTPVLMEQMLQIKRLFKSNKVNFSFFDNKLFIVIHSRKNWFEMERLSNSDYYVNAKKCFEQMNALLAVVDILPTE